MPPTAVSGANPDAPHQPDGQLVDVGIFRERAKGSSDSGHSARTEPTRVTPVPYEVAWTGAAQRALTRLLEKVGTAVIEFCYGALAENPERAIEHRSDVYRPR